MLLNPRKLPFLPILSEEHEVLDDGLLLKSFEEEALLVGGGSTLDNPT